MIYWVEWVNECNDVFSRMSELGLWYIEYNELMRVIIFLLLWEYNFLERKKEDGIKFVEKFVISI